MFKFLILKPSKSNGFTLIELIIVFIVLGVLSATALPNFLRQVGKARESEIKNALGTVARGQMSFHWENQEFCCSSGLTSDILTRIGASINSKYISSWNFDISNLSTQITFTTNNINWDNDGTRGFSGGVFFNSTTSSGFQAIMCQSFEPSITTTVPVLTPPECGSNAERLR